MTIYVCGGSNSIRRGGWLSYFDQRSTNLSIGAATSIMGAYRAMFCADLKPGDTVLWEYALNDSNQSSAKDRHYSNDLLLGYLEYIIRHCALKGARLIALIFTPRQRELVPGVDGYRKRLHALLDHYNIPKLDVSQELRAAQGTETLSPEEFADDFHYQTDGMIVQYIGQRASEMVQEPFRAVDADRTHFILYPDQRLLFKADAPAGIREEFSNSLLTLPVVRIDADPIEYAPFEQDVSLVGIMLVTTPRAGALRFEIVGTDESVKAFHLHVRSGEAAIQKPILVMFSFITALGIPFTCKKGDRIRISSARGRAKILRNPDFVSPKRRNSGVREIKIAGVLCETQVASALSETGLSSERSSSTSDSQEIGMSDNPKGFNEAELQFRAALMVALWKTDNKDRAFSDMEEKKSAYAAEKSTYFSKANQVIVQLKTQGINVG